MAWRDSYFTAFEDAGIPRSTKWGATQQPLSDKWGADGGYSSPTESKWGAFDPGYSLQDVLNHYGETPDWMQAPSAGQGGPIGSPQTSEWQGVNQWDPVVQQVASATGVPANAIKAIMRIESQGTLDAISPMTSSGQYFGLMQIGATSSVPEYMKSQEWLRGNAYNQILAGATELANKYQAIGATSWSQAAAAYFGYGTDVLGTTTGQYTNNFDRYMAELGTSTTAAGEYIGGNDALNTMFGGNFNPQGWGAFGVQSSNGLYGYGTSYGLDGTQHTGLDVPLAIDSPIYAPAAATVTCVGCWKNDYLGQGLGRIELTMPDGTRILYDHSSTGAVQVGQSVQPGQLLGTSGGMNSPHIHLEVRVPDPSTSSGYRLVDPQMYFSGMPGSSYGQAYQQQWSPQNEWFNWVFGR